MSEIKAIVSKSPGRLAEGSGFAANLRGTPDGALYQADWVHSLLAEGRVFTINGGIGTTPITFGAAYDATAPDAYIYVPNNTLVIPLHIRVIYDAVGTEATMEIIAQASATGDSSATGTAATIKNMRIGSTVTSSCTATVAVDASGVDTPVAGQNFEFWRKARPLTDTVATTENDRHELVFDWTAFVDGIPPYIMGDADGAALAVYAASQAGTGFIIVQWAEIAF